MSNNFLKDIISRHLCCYLWASEGQDPSEIILLAFVEIVDDTDCPGKLWLIEEVKTFYLMGFKSLIFSPFFHPPIGTTVSLETTNSLLDLLCYYGDQEPSTDYPFQQKEKSEDLVMALVIIFKVSFGSNTSKSGRLSCHMIGRLEICSVLRCGWYSSFDKKWCRKRKRFKQFNPSLLKNILTLPTSYRKSFDKKCLGRHMLLLLIMTT